MTENSEEENVGSTEGGSAWLEVFQVLYSPIKAFKKIVEKPQLRGPILIFVIVIILAIVGQCVQASKLFLETDVPGKTVPLLTTDRIVGLILPILPIAVSVIVRWPVYVAILLLILKLLRNETRSWSAFFSIIGYVFSVWIVYFIASVLMFSTLPTVTLPLKTWPPTDAESAAVTAAIDKNWGATWVFQAGLYFINYVASVWMAALSAIAIHTSHKLTWGKALIISAIAAVVIFLLSLIGF